MQQRQRLDSWKEIAVYLRRDVRTVMRWEKRAAMPVHRVPGARPGLPVFAYADELDRWLDAAPATRRRLIRPIIVWATVLIGATATIAAWSAGLLQAKGPLPLASRVQAAGNAVVGVDTSGREAWSWRLAGDYTFAEDIVARPLDLPTGKGGWVVSGNTTGPWQPTSLQGELYAFSRTGHLLWRHVADDVLQFGAGAFRPPWIARGLFLVPANGEMRIAWTVHHYTWWPAMLIVADTEGAITGRYVNAGWLNTASVLRRSQGDWLLVGGISNSRSAAMMAILDAEHVAGSSPEEAGSDYACNICGPERPLRYFVFPQTEVGKALGRPYNEVGSIRVSSSGVTVITREGSPESGLHWVYEFSHAMQLQRAQPGDNYWMLHRQARLRGDIDHLEDDCPEHSPVPILSWTERSGWVEVEPKAESPALRPRPEVGKS